MPHRPGCWHDAKKVSPIWSASGAAAAVVGPGAAAGLDSPAVRPLTTRSPICESRPHWWRTGEQTQITRMGSPLTFWKLQQVPVLWLLDRLGRRDLIDDPIGHQQELLPLVRPERSGSGWWRFCSVAAGAGGSTAPGRWLWPPGFSPSPNLIAHGGLVTMELPLLACTTACSSCSGISRIRADRAGSGRPPRWADWPSRASSRRCCFPPILAVVWWLDGWHRAAARLVSCFRLTRAGGLWEWRPIVLVMLLANLLHRVRTAPSQPVHGGSSQHQAEVRRRRWQVARPALRDARSPGLGGDWPIRSITRCRAGRAICWANGG